MGLNCTLDWVLVMAKIKFSHSLEANRTRDEIAQAIIHMQWYMNNA